MTSYTVGDRKRFSEILRACQTWCKSTALTPSEVKLRKFPAHVLMIPGAETGKPTRLILTDGHAIVSMSVPADVVLPLERCAIDPKRTLDLMKVGAPLEVVEDNFPPIEQLERVIPSASRCYDDRKAHEESGSKPPTFAPALFGRTLTLLACLTVDRTLGASIHLGDTHGPARVDLYDGDDIVATVAVMPCRVRS